MALKSTVFKVNLSVADLGRQYYADHALTIARHPSETDIRMLVRVVAFALNAHERLQFTKGLSNAEEPDLWQLDLTGDIEHWIDLGQPAEKRIRQSCSKANRVSIYTYQKRAAGPWFADIKDSLERFKHLSVTHLAVSDEKLLSAMIDRTMDLQCTIDEQQVLVTNSVESLTIDMDVAKAAVHP